jgi:hypothetical protein
MDQPNITKKPNQTQLIYEALRTAKGRVLNYEYLQNVIEEASPQVELADSLTIVRNVISRLRNYTSSDCRYIKPDEVIVLVRGVGYCLKDKAQVKAEYLKKTESKKAALKTRRQYKPTQSMLFYNELAKNKGRPVPLKQLKNAISPAMRKEPKDVEALFRVLATKVRSSEYSEVALKPGERLVHAGPAGYLLIDI